MDEYEQAYAERGRVLRTPCLYCGRSSGWCITPGGHEIRNVYKQHNVRYQRAGVEVGVLRALLVKAGLV